MSLRELKKEAAKLSSVKDSVKRFQKSWIQPLRENNNYHLPFLQELPKEVRKDINRKLFLLQDNIKGVQHGQLIQDKLRHHARNLIELKLSMIRDDKRKLEVVTNNLLNDDFFNIKRTISEVNTFDENVKLLRKSYDEINGMISENVKLDEMVHFMDLPHEMHLKTLLSISRKQKKLIKSLGENFVSLVKEAKEI